MEYNTVDKKNDRYSRMRETMIAKHGSLEAWKEHMHKIGSKGGKNGDNRPFRDKKIASKAGKISAQVRKKK